MKKILLITIIALGACASASCVHLQPVPPGAATCTDVCAHGDKLGCTWAAPTNNGAICTDVCQLAQTSPLPWNLSCAAKAESCEAASACQ
jgi:hypothetical protein